MKHLLCFCLILFIFKGYSQEGEVPKKFVLDATPFYGSIVLHNPDISHLITEHPRGIILGLSKKRYGHEDWEADLGYPDTGFTFVYQDMNNATLGEHFGLYAHYNFYFLKRNLQLRIGQGVAYNTNPYDKNNNFRNNAYGTHLLASTVVLLNYHKENLFKGMGVKAGLTLIHYSNANFRAPNTSTNTMAFNVGLTYNLDGGKTYDYIEPKAKEKITEPIRYNLVLRSGVNESDVINSGQYGFWILSAYADKRLGGRSAIQFGVDAFFSNFLKELIRFQSISFPELNVDSDTDFKRVGLFVGHELFVNKLSIETQLGYYVYYPFDFEGRVYNRIGLKRYFGGKIFGAITLKSHGAKAEALEFGIGVRL
ncbi:acyloxyacyl hydrolase [Flagellimonas allohymeniacidonis]|uniref:Acyloxyacyl hydrolase n=1 Tax=Flagellimonas allohymeniacidonis TaxID=2517819 RepID=A0A4Q8QF30_9FLAO|nr:acyloxyacyl hydrolase [Allomuricauda hymeniacidonis]TAI46919.1 acyloxyacyl hydrolase [Allomuricauda hymeniacidonis]